MASASQSIASGYLACSAALTASLADTGARALAVAVARRNSPHEVNLAGASSGAAIAFTDLCMALAEAPADRQLRQIDVAGVGQISWKAQALDDGETELFLFALHENGRSIAWAMAPPNAALGF